MCRNRIRWEAIRDVATVANWLCLVGNHEDRRWVCSNCRAAVAWDVVGIGVLAKLGPSYESS